ncbi:hypothetical protein B5C39_01680 [Mesomycoplasma hyopneumoniae]|nr:hypothetical protein B5C39_01680 [Mesomycoplasma hyopneumoniae]
MVPKFDFLIHWNFIHYTLKNQKNNFFNFFYKKPLKHVTFLFANKKANNGIGVLKKFFFGFLVQVLKIIKKLF